MSGSGIRVATAAWETAPDSQRLAMRKEDGVVGLWSVDRWQQVAVINDPRSGPVWTYGKIRAFSRDGSLLALRDYSELQVRDARDLSVVTKLPYTSPISEGIHSRIESVAWSKKYLAVGYRDGVLRLWEGTFGGPNSLARSLNNRGQVVGFAFTADNSQHAFVWENGVLLDLNDHIAPDSGWVLISATAINARGQIAGFGSHNGSIRAFLLTLGRHSEQDDDE